MGLRSTISKAAQAAFKAAGDVPVTAYVRSLTTQPTYDATTGKYLGDIATVYECKAVRTRSEKLENRAGVQTNDRFYIVRQAQVAAANVDDEFIITDENFVFRVLKVEPDPADATWTLWIRIKETITDDIRITTISELRVTAEGQLRGVA